MKKKMAMMDGWMDTSRKLSQSTLAVVCEPAVWLIKRKEHTGKVDMEVANLPPDKVWLLACLWLTLDRNEERL